MIDDTTQFIQQIGAFDENMRLLISISIAICILFIVIALLILKFVNGIIVKVRQSSHHHHHQTEQNTLQAHFTTIASGNNLNLSDNNHENYGNQCEIHHIHKQPQVNLVSSIDYRNPIVGNSLGEQIPAQPNFHFIHYHYHQPMDRRQKHIHQHHL